MVACFLYRALQISTFFFFRSKLYKPFVDLNFSTEHLIKHLKIHLSTFDLCIPLTQSLELPHLANSLRRRDFPAFPLYGETSADDVIPAGPRHEMHKQSVAALQFTRDVSREMFLFFHEFTDCVSELQVLMASDSYNLKAFLLLLFSFIANQ